MPLNGYVRYLNANRERLKQDHPELPFAEVTKRLASEWSSHWSIKSHPENVVKIIEVEIL